MKLLLSDENIMNSCDTVYIPYKKFTYKKGNRIAIRTNHLPVFFKEVSISEPCHLVTGFVDYAPELFFTETEFKRIIDYPLILSWEAMNTTFNHPKLVHIGRGFYPETTKFFEKHSKLLKQIPKTNDTFYCFSVDPNTKERKDLPNCEKMPLKEYAYTLATYKYVYCPMGLGIDCSKVYEAVACGCIPIVKVPVEFLDTYKNFNFVNLPGTCYFCVGILDQFYKVRTKYIPERTDIDNSIDLCTFESDKQINNYKDVIKKWQDFNDFHAHGFHGLKTTDTVPVQEFIQKIY